LFAVENRVSDDRNRGAPDNMADFVKTP